MICLAKKGKKTIEQTVQFLTKMILITLMCFRLKLNNYVNISIDGISEIDVCAQRGVVHWLRVNVVVVHCASVLMQCSVKSA